MIDVGASRLSEVEKASSHGSAALCFSNVSASYGPYRALFSVSFSVPAGSVVALLGANGAGKSTVARVATGLVPVTGGHVFFHGTDITGWSAWRIARLGLVHAPEGRSVFATLTVEENLELDFVKSAGRHRADQAVERAYGFFPRLKERRRQLAGTLSGGEQRMLSLARVLSVPPKMLIVDELTFGLSPGIAAEVFSSLRALKDQGCTLLVVEQHVHQALAIAERAVVLAHGSIAYEGPISEMGDLAERLLGGKTAS
ncbi:MAG: ABC transporter ATP-binding protein [Actinobacteria bacterium]|nr:ABC transporter ATP-binding protein [Actinomycetota bacterium]